MKVNWSSSKITMVNFLCSFIIHFILLSIIVAIVFRLLFGDFGLLHGSPILRIFAVMYFSYRFPIKFYKKDDGTI